MIGKMFDVMRLHQLHQNTPTNLICNSKSPMVKEFSTIEGTVLLTGPSVRLTGGSVSLTGLF